MIEKVHLLYMDKFSGDRKLLDEYVYIWMLSVLILVSAFRDGLGTDYYTYKFFFENPEYSNDEFLFKYFFTELLGFLFDDAVSFFFLTSFVISVCCGYVIKKMSYNKLYSLCLYVFLVYLVAYNIVAQSVMISIFAFVIVWQTDDFNRLKYFVIVLFVSLIHLSAFWLLLLLLYSEKYGYKVLMVLWGGSFVVYLMNVFGVNWWESVLEVMGRYLVQGDFGYKYLMNTKVYLLEDTVGYRVFVRNVIFFVLVHGCNRNKNCRCMEIGRYKFLWLMGLAGLIGGNIFSFTSQVGFRLMLFNDFAIIILITLYLKSMLVAKSRLLYAIIFFAYFAVESYYRFIFKGEGGIFI